MRQFPVFAAFLLSGQDRVASSLLAIAINSLLATSTKEVVACANMVGLVYQRRPRDSWFECGTEGAALLLGEELADREREIIKSWFSSLERGQQRRCAALLRSILGFGDYEVTRLPFGRLVAQSVVGTGVPSQPSPAR
jgi:hypothetical protein